MKLLKLVPENTNLDFMRWRNVALVLSILSGMALRSGALAWLSHNRGVRIVHGFLTVLWIPLGLAHVIALLFDRYAQIGLIDLVIPFGVSYGRLAIGLGTISMQLILVVLVSTWLRSSLSNGQWQWFHRLSYIAFFAAFAHGVMSGTDLANPVVAALAWITAAAVALVALRRVTRLRIPA